MTVRPAVLLSGIVAASAVALVLLMRSGCHSGPTTVERHVDSTLATVPAWRDTVAARDSVLAIRDQERAKLRRQSATQRARADKSEAVADSLQHVADSLSGLPDSTVDQVRFALEGQKRVSAQLRGTIGELKAQRTTDSLRLHLADSTLSLVVTWRAEDQARIDELTKDLGDLRADTKHRGDWNLPLGIHLPRWAHDAALIGIAGYAGYRVGRAAT